MCNSETRYFHFQNKASTIKYTERDVKAIVHKALFDMTSEDNNQFTVSLSDNTHNGKQEMQVFF